MDDTGDCGEIWFGESVERRMIKWIMAKFGGNSEIMRICELGSGNGHLLCLLYQKGFMKLTGTDYSLSAIELAKKLAEEEDCDAINWEQCDILDDSTPFMQSNEGSFDLLLDKGTLDAISLKPSADIAAEGVSVENIKNCATDQSAVYKYVENVWKLCKPSGGLLMITSCNWTENELISILKQHFSPIDRIEHPSLQFGGKVGQTVTTVIFERNNIL